MLKSLVRLIDLTNGCDCLLALPQGEWQDGVGPQEDAARRPSTQVGGLRLDGGVGLHDSHSPVRGGSQGGGE